MRAAPVVVQFKLLHEEVKLSISPFLSYRNGCIQKPPLLLTEKHDEDTLFITEGWVNFRALSVSCQNLFVNLFSFHVSTTTTSCGPFCCFAVKYFTFVCHLFLIHPVWKCLEYLFMPGCNKVTHLLFLLLLSLTAGRALQQSLYGFSNKIKKTKMTFNLSKCAAHYINT